MFTWITSKSLNLFFFYIVRHIAIGFQSEADTIFSPI